MKRDEFFSYDRKRDWRKHSADPVVKEDVLALERLKSQPTRRTYRIDVSWP